MSVPPITLTDVARQRLLRAEAAASCSTARTIPPIPRIRPDRWSSSRHVRLLHVPLAGQRPGVGLWLLPLRSSSATGAWRSSAWSAWSASCLHPITKKSQVSMMKMGKMGPEIERLKKKYGDDKDVLNKAMMESTRNRASRRSSAACRCSCRCRSGSPCGAPCKAPSSLRQAPFLWGIHLDQGPGPAATSCSPFADTSPFRCSFIHDLVGINILPILMARGLLHPAEATPQARPRRPPSRSSSRR